MGPKPNTVSAQLQHLASTQPDKPAFIFVDAFWRRRVLSRADVLRYAARYAAILHRKGFRRGDIVCNTLPNSPERLLSDLGVILAGGVAMNGQLLLADGADFLGSLKDSACVAAILDPREHNGAMSLLRSKQSTTVGKNGDLRYEDLPSLRMLLPCYWEGEDEELSFMEILRQETETYFADVSPYDVAYIWTTSGSTGFSKLVPRQHRQVADSVSVFYGSTDNGVISRHLITDPDAYTDCNNGKPLPGVEVKVVDQALKEVPVGQLGEVLVRSDTVLTHYIGNEKATENTLMDGGWARTGDVGHVSSDGDLYVVCRVSFGIMRGAYVLYPGWLETRISRCPGVETAVVVPVPDPVLYQELCACVVTSTSASSGVHVTEEKVREFCESLFLTGKNDQMTAVPRYFLFFDELPLTTTGKVCRRTLREMALKRLGMEDESVAIQ
nr:hypothetical protein BaRGS_025860 [Batillaria attramentaria]